MRTRGFATGWGRLLLGLAVLGLLPGSGQAGAFGPIELVVAGFEVSGRGAVPLAKDDPSDPRDEDTTEDGYRFMAAELRAWQHGGATGSYDIYSGAFDILVPMRMSVTDIDGDDVFSVAGASDGMTIESGVFQLHLAGVVPVLSGFEYLGLDVQVFDLAGLSAAVQLEPAEKHTGINDVELWDINGNGLADTLLFTDINLDIETGTATLYSSAGIPTRLVLAFQATGSATGDVYDPLTDPPFALSEVVGLAAQPGAAVPAPAAALLLGTGLLLLGGVRRRARSRP